jgi:asparagine synthase (glutamine-hydrolysing)
MLHLDVWWRGVNVLVDAGSYLYNGPARWHNHFMRTGSHNTVALDGRDQMVHFRQFKVLYWTKATLLRFEDHADWAICEGEHYGYQRHPGRAVHRRGVLYLKDDVWVVVDWVLGSGSHRARLHWLCGDFDYRLDPATCRVELATRQGPFTVEALDETGAPMVGDVVAGQDDPPRGWQSRYYGEKVPVPSFVVEQAAPLPVTFVSVLSGGAPSSVAVANGRWRVIHGDATIEFAMQSQRFAAVSITRSP